MEINFNQLAVTDYGSVLGREQNQAALAKYASDLWACLYGAVSFWR